MPGNGSGPCGGGYLTVFLAMTLTVIISLCLALVEGVRRNTMVLETECVTDIGMNSVLAEFHRKLLEEYGLFFIDTSYGTAYPSYEETGRHLKEYMNRNFKPGQGFWEPGSRNLLDLRAEEAEITEVSVASDDGGAVLRRQAVECVKEKIGIGYIEKILGWMQVVTDNGLNGKNFRTMEQNAWETLEAWKSSAEDTGAVYEIKNPASNIWSAIQAGVLILVTDLGSLSGRRVSPETYLSHRERNRGTGMPPERDYRDDLADQALFGEYVLDRTGRYGSPKEGGALAYQSEYILGGYGSDVENLRYVAECLLFVREAANALHIAADEEKMAAAKRLADALAAAATIPEAAPAFQVTLIGAWAGLESLRDVKLLFSGKKVPLIKTKEDWHFGFDGLAQFQGEVETGEGGGSGLTYEDYLRILLLLQDRETTACRTMDIMEMDIRLTEGNRFFRMDGCVDSLKVTIWISGGYGYHFSITRRCGYD